jgi:HemY protein
VKRLIFLFLVLLLAVWAGVKIAADPGYILLAYHRWTVEMPLWFGVLAIFVGFTLIYTVIRMLHRAGQVTADVHHWSSERRARLGFNRLQKGLRELSAGHWRQAEKYLLKASSAHQDKLPHFLALARAAQGRGDVQARDRYLRQAQQSDPEAEIPVALTQAELQFHHGQLEQALATLRHLQQLAPDHKYVLQLLFQVYKALNDWHALSELLPQLARLHVLPVAELKAAQLETYRHCLQQAGRHNDVEQLNTMWQTLPKSLNQDVALVSCYGEQLLKCGQDVALEAFLKTQLKKQWQDKWVELYGLCQGEDASKQLAYAETWLKKQANNPVLLLALGRLAIRAQFWGKARTYLENSLELSPNVDAYATLAHLLEKMGEVELANQYYREGVKLKQHA